MIENIKSRKSMAFMALRILWKLVILSLQVIASFASDGQSKPRYTAGKAQQLYEEDAITGSEYAKCIHGE
ncbi:hypothetical protein [Legionella sp.]|uniref:hypothetical protein n=1 Tax=Legionella sp. TaxID=459 RepID=UPI000CB4C09F|nr:hypothetical protein [Legionella sp.]PJE14662.1 MAG: hypothetical protein CK430_04865 [Legionella sp.]